MRGSHRFIDLRTMTRVWLGNLAIADALRVGALRLAGSTVLRLSFHDWIGLSPFVHLDLPARARAPPPGAGFVQAPQA